MRLREPPVRRPLGAVPLGGGPVEFRVWAPNARTVAVRLRGDDELRAFYAELLRLRRELPRDVETTVDGAILRVRRGPVELVADLEQLTVELRR